MIIKIKHQVEKEDYEFEVANPDNLTANEVKRICKKMKVDAFFINGKYYEK